MSATGEGGASNRRLLGLVRFLQLHGTATLTEAEGGWRVAAAGRELPIAADVVGRALSAGLANRKGNRLVLRPEAGAWLRRALHPEGGHAEQHGSRAQRTLADAQVVTVNQAESPLARLHFRKDRDGTAWLDAEQFAAGEKLRLDFERARLQPRITANWEASVAGRGRGAAAGEISDFALDCRKRLNAALDALEPSLAGVAVDVCCFLKGLEQVERERRWPPRSAKLMLRTALSLLAGHYGLRPRCSSGGTRHWGADDYKPRDLTPSAPNGPPA